MRALIGFAALVFVALLAIHPAGAQALRQAVISPDSDYYGFDLRTEQDVTQAECQNICIADPSCRAFTYNPKVSWCFLKSDFNQLNTFAGAVAGKIVDAAGGEDIGAPVRLPFVSDQLLADARAQRDGLALTEDQQQAGVDALTAAGREALGAGDPAGAVAAFRGALAITPEDTGLWLELSAAARSVPDNYELYAQAAQAALNAYDLTRTAEARAAAIAALAGGLEVTQSWRPALDAYKASLALVEDPAVRAAYVDLKARQGFRITENTIDNDSASPRACVQFSEPLVKSGVDYSTFVTLDGAAPQAIEAKGSQICVEGLSHGQRYSIGLRAGLPSSVDEALEAPVELSIYVRDRSATVRFTGDGFVLPSTARRGIPLVSVNADSANLKLYRIGDRGIAPLLTNSQFLTQVDGYSAQRIEDENGQLVWQGTIDIASEQNRDVVTSFPVDEALPERKPGVYVLTAIAKDQRREDWDAQATQWFVVSDIGLATFAGTDGLTVFARSLSDATPLAGVELQMLAKNNEILGTAVTDPQGRASFTAGLMRGTAAMTPAVMTARKGDADYVFLDMTRAGFDLSDRGVTGRAAPGAIDVFAYTERGIYRAGETVHAAALARDSAARAIEGLPLTFVFLRPDGVEDRRVVSPGVNLGGHAVDLALQANAMRGTWAMQVRADPKGSAIAQASFLVDDFVPDRIEFDLASTASDIEVGGAAMVTVDGRYLYGAPAAGLELEGELVLKPTRSVAALPGFSFGLADEEAQEESRIPLDDLPLLDENGKAELDVGVTDVPATTQAVSAEVVVRLREAGGRAVERSIVLPVRAQGPMIGIKPEFTGSVAENSVGRFRVISVAPDNSKQAFSGLSWKLVSVERNYQWYRDGSSWRYEPIVTTKQVATGTLDGTIDGGEITVPVTWGRYRLEVATADVGGPMSSVEFDAGFYVEATSTETPDGLEIALDKASYAVGDTARLKIAPRFAGEVLVTVGSENLIATATATIPAGGGEVELPVTADWGGGAYVTATLYRPGIDQESRMPMRAIGIKWLSVDPAERKLAVAFDLPEKTLPRQPLAIPVSVTGAGIGDEAYVMIAAVDVGILNLTRYEAPSPDGWYFGQRRLGLEMRDLYGRLIDGSLGATGRLRTGGDGGQVALEGSPPTEKLVAFFSGPVALDAQGRATISFDIPQFNGTARVMAVAWSKAGVGHAAQDVIIRDPVVVTASAPKFLAPGDRASLRLDIANTDGATGDYTLDVTGNAGVSVDQPDDARIIRLDQGASAALTLPLEGVLPGDGLVSIRLSDASGLSFEQAVAIPVRPAALPVTTRRPVTIAGNGSLTVDTALLYDSLLEGASVSVSVTRAAAFDVPAMLMSLDRYPLGCAEQTTSRALPLLYLSELSGQSELAADPAIRTRIQDSIYRVLAFQSSSGSFGLWSPGYGDLWLDAYVTDFLTRAREKAFDVPEEAMVQALDNLQNSLAYDVNVREKGNEIAYASYVLARNRKAAISDLRYYADTMLDDFPTPLAKAHIAAALALYGDVERSQRIFEGATRMSQETANVSLVRSDYGSALRDGAAVLALAAESRPLPAMVPQMTTFVGNQWDAKGQTSTQEQAWMLLAARALGNADADLALEVDGVAHIGTFARRLTGDALLTAPLTIANRTSEPVTAVVTTLAVPSEPLPAGGDGFAITRGYYTLDGEEANISEAVQSERYVVVLTATLLNDGPARIAITDLLPAGFEIDNPGLVNSAQLSSFDWLEEVSPAHTEFRSDRFIAAIDHVAGDANDVTLAYVVRAVTPGTYDHPAAQVEDMYRPQLSARTATGRMEVVAAP